MKAFHFNPSLAHRILPLLVIGLFITTMIVMSRTEEVLEDSILDLTKQKAVIYLLGMESTLQLQKEPLNKEFLSHLIERSMRHTSHDMGFSIHQIYFFNQQGKILVHSEPGIHKNKIIKDHYIRVFEQGEHYLGDKIEYFTDASGVKIPKLDIIVPLHYNGQVIAAMEVELNLQGTQQQIKQFDNQYENELMVIMLGSAVFMLLFFWWGIKSWVLAPIGQLDVVASRIAKGELDARANIKSNNELGRLGDSINHMAHSIESLFNEQENAHLQMLQSLAKALEAKDAYTAGHSGRVARFSVKLGKCAGLSTEQLALIKKGALLHDLGKIGIADSILNKPSALDEHEYEIMKRHPVMTATIMKPLTRFKEFVEIASWHHERWDGNGYPDGLTGEETPLLARIVGIADTWDAMTGDRVYRKGMSIEKALSILIKEKMSGQWDPQLLQLFIDMIKKEQADRGNVESDMFDA